MSRPVYLQGQELGTSPAIEMGGCFSSGWLLLLIPRHRPDLHRM